VLRLGIAAAFGRKTSPIPAPNRVVCRHVVRYVPLARASPFRLYSRIVNALREELLQLTPVYQQVENGWTQASLIELPGVITAAPSRDEAQEMLLDALREFLLSFGPGPMSAPTNVEPDALTLTISVGRNPAA
jgi:hypothetical protein